MSYGRCVEFMKVQSAYNQAYPQLSTTLAMGPILYSQGSSLRALAIHADLANITGADSVILVSTYPDYLVRELALSNDCLLSGQAPCADNFSRLRHLEHNL